MVDEVVSRGCCIEFSVVEVFSGPKAPLTEAIKNYILLGCSPRPEFGPSPSAPPLSPPQVVGFGVQGYGPAAKVEFSFPDGLNDPWLHLAALQH